jgi:hypothetical protein
MEAVKDNELDEKIQQLMEQRDDEIQTLKKILKALDQDKG